MNENSCYNKNYISRVIFRIDLANPIKELELQLPKEIGLKVKKYYPIFEPQEMIGGELRIDNMGINNLGTNHAKRWVFYSRDRKNTCTIFSECIMFNYSIYNNFNDIKSVILDIVKTINKKYEKNELSANRIGMRFINVIPLDGNSNYINRDIIAHLDRYKESKLMRAITSVEYYAEELEIYVRNQCGYVNQDYPAEMVNDSFTIDIDVYTKGINYLDEIDKLIDSMHDEVGKVFEGSITDDLRNKMKQI